TDRARRRPARARPPVLALLGEGQCARLAAARAVRRGTRADGQVVSRERLVVGADPLGGLRQVLRTPVRACAGGFTALLRSSNARPRARASASPACSCPR